MVRQLKVLLTDENYGEKKEEERKKQMYKLFHCVLMNWEQYSLWTATLNSQKPQSILKGVIPQKEC